MSFVMCEDLIKKYDDCTAVRSISFDVRQGEVFGILGHSGAGKSTTIKIVAGLCKPNYGNVRIAGIDLYSNLKQLKVHIGYVPQNLVLYEQLSVRENLNLYGRLYSFHWRHLMGRVNELLAQMGLADSAATKVKTLPIGMKRMLNLAIALLHSPTILCLDDPMAGTDAQSRNVVFEYLRELAVNGTTIIYSAQSEDEVQELCDRVAIIDKGQVVVLDLCENVLGKTEPQKIREKIMGSWPESLTCFG